jgi:hypothetical protein
MPFWRRGRPAEERPEPPSARPIVGTLPCSERGCTNDTGESCGYVDRRARACGTAWCPDHQSVVGGTVYCRRHAGVVGALGGEQQAAMPDLENRAPSLVNWVARDVEEVIREIVAGHGAELGTDRLIADPVRLVFLGPERLRVWERSWKLVAHTGWSLRVSLEVDEARDTEVAVRVGRNVVVRMTPPWIAARMRGERLDDGTDAALRDAFYRELTASVAGAVDAELRRNR